MITTEKSNKINELIKELKNIEWMLKTFPLANPKDLTWKDDEKKLKEYREILYRELMVLVIDETKNR